MFKEKIRKKLNNIDVVLLIFILIASVFSIKKEELLYRNIHICINIIMLIYIGINYYKKKNLKIIQSKLDIFLVLLVISTIVPLIFNSFVSLSDTVKTILNYITLLWVYILIRQICKKNENQIYYIKNIIIIFTIILIIFGIENLCTNKIFEFFKVDNIVNGEKRLVSLITNPNIFSALIMLTFFISLNEMTISISNKKKVLYGISNSIFILGILLTYSKLTFIILPFLLIVYFILIKNRSKRIYMAHNVIQSLIMSLIYIFIFQKLLSKQYYLSILLFSLLWLEIVFLWNKLIVKTNNYLEKINIKTYIISIILVLIVSIVWLNLELQNTKEFVVFAENTQSDYNSKVLKKISPNTKYVFSFDIDSKVWGIDEKKIKDFYIIRIIERDSRNLNEITSKEVKLDNYSGKKEIEIFTNENTSEIKIEFKAKTNITSKSFILKKLLLNNEEVTLEYKHLPTKLIEKIKDIDFQYKTAQERIHFIKDGWKLICNNFLTGIGGQGWSYKFGEVQEYGYSSSDMHCYYLQVWLEFGILGLISLLGITIFIIYPGKINKDRMDNYRGIQYGLIALLIHCLLDVDMVLCFTQIMFFLNLGMYSSIVEIKNNKTKSYISGFLVSFITVITIVLFYKQEFYDGKYIISNLKIENDKIDENSEQYKNNYNKIYKTCEKVLNYERYNLALTDYATESIDAYILSENDNVEEELEKYYKRITPEKNKWKHEINNIVQKNTNINNVMLTLENQNNPKFYPWLVKLAKINIDEFEETRQELENALAEKYKRPADEIQYAKLLENFDYANRIYEKYYFGIKINNTTEVDLTSFTQNDDFKIDNKQDIVIYHTHTTEAYNSNDYEEIEYKKTLDEKYNILSVGEELSNHLQQKGIRVTHLKTYNDIDGIKKAYDNSYTDVKNYLEKQEKNIDIVFDIHRDSYEGNEKEEKIIEIDSKKVARLRFIIAVGHDNWENNLNWAIKVQKKADEMYPNLFKEMYIYTGNYNQDVSNCATLIEVGHDENTVEEAKNSMEYLANVIKDVLED